MNKSKRLGIDIDGTITSPTTFLPYINKSFQLELTLQDLKEYDLHKVIGISDREFYQWMIQHEHAIYKNASLVEHVHTALSKWKEQHQLIFISARNNDYIDVTRDWFAHQAIPYDHLELLGSHNKLDAVKRHDVDVFFEDKHDNACDISEEFKIPVILFNTPYNQNAVPKNVIRVNNWSEAYSWVNRYFSSESLVQA